MKIYPQVYLIIIFLFISGISVKAQNESVYFEKLQGNWSNLDQYKKIKCQEDYNELLIKYRELRIEGRNIHFYNLLEDTIAKVGVIISINDKSFNISVEESFTNKIKRSTNSIVKSQYRRIDNSLILWEDKKR